MGNIWVSNTEEGAKEGTEAWRTCLFHFLLLNVLKIDLTIQFMAVVWKINDETDCNPFTSEVSWWAWLCAGAHCFSLQKLLGSDYILITYQAHGLSLSPGLTLSHVDLISTAKTGVFLQLQWRWFSQITWLKLTFFLSKLAKWLLWQPRGQILWICGLKHIALTSIDHSRSSTRFLCQTERLLPW